MEKVCPKCNVTYITKDPRRKYCSVSCSNASKCGRLVSKDSIRKRNETLLSRYGTRKPTSTKHSEATKQKLRAIAVQRTLQGRNHHVGKKGRYKGIWCDSSYELAWVIFHLDHLTEFKRCTDTFSYSFDGGTFSYIPDFKVHGFWVEIKGFETPSRQIQLHGKSDDIENAIANSIIREYIEYAPVAQLDRARDFI